MLLDPTIFKAYDVRGIYPSSLNEDVAYHFGRAFVTFLKAKTVVVGYDARLSSPKLKKALERGLCEQGAKVIDIGLCTSPLLNFTVASHSEYNSGIMITASHNPASYNGFKTCRSDASAIGSENGLLEIKEIMVKQNYPLSSPGHTEKINPLPFYIDYLKGLIDFAQIRDLKVVVDVSNGSAGQQVQEIFKELDCTIIPLNFKPDGRFPHHEPDPLKEENLTQIKEKVKKEKADLGIILDGDADRVRFIDEKGNAVPADLITAFLIKRFLKQEKKSAVVYDLRSSLVVKEEIEKYNGRPVICRVGHTFIKQKMRETKAIFGGEVSGHYYFRDLFYTDNADYAYLILMSLLKQTKESFSGIMRPYRRYFQTEELNFEVEDQKSVLENIENYYAQKYPDLKISQLDGLSIYLPEFWFNVRPSNTEPVLRVKLEASTDKLREEKTKELISLIK